MNILQVGTALHGWGGIERYVSYLSEGLIERGHKVWCTCPHDSELSRRCPANIVEIKSRGKHDPLALWQHKKLIEEHKIDVVHIHFTPDMYIGSLAARLTKCPKIILTRHVAEPWHPLKSYAYGSLVHHVIAVSDAVGEVLVASGIDPEDVTVAKAGSPPLCCEPCPDKSKGPFAHSGFTFGIAGRLVREKGVDIAIQAAAINHLPIEVVGEGQWRSTLEAQVSSSGAPVTFHGFTDKIAEFLAAIDCLIVPSRWAEAFPFAVLEAMSAGKPVIAANVGGLPEMVEDGFTGLLFECVNAEDLAQKMVAISSNPESARRMGENAQLRYRANYTVRDMTRRIEEVYMKVGRKTATKKGRLHESQPL
jgi:glycosyltransferase involved in cell wall biosynthesis